MEYITGKRKTVCTLQVPHYMMSLVMAKIGGIYLPILVSSHCSQYWKIRLDVSLGHQ